MTLMELVGVCGGFLLGVAFSAAHNVPRVRDLKREIEFWRHQAREYEERERIVAQEIARLKGH